MNDDLEWAKIRKPKPSNLQNVSSGVLRVAMLFGGLAIAMGLFVTPLLDRDSDNRVLANIGNKNIDPITTASTRKNSNSVYVVRRSVLQSVPGSKCILHSNGTATGDC